MHIVTTGRRVAPANPTDGGFAAGATTHPVRLEPVEVRPNSAPLVTAFDTLGTNGE